MTKKRFIFQLLFLLLIISWGIAFGGNPFLLYLDTPSLIITPIAPYIVLSFIYPFSKQGEINREVFSNSEANNKVVLEQAIAFFELFKRLVILGAVLGTFIGFIGIMGYLSEMTEPSIIGRNIGVLAICPFYATVFIYAVIEPLKGVAKKKLIG
ncbi:hypothetical protein EW093_07635 [Thiospirochaeta perfilievii]|uniref:MotA/TolQ/ExbB proton channel domain-containing protein n=1 Tax=Thiospirochaeta perfilievii TaxID=252967 RepID=A0A5C1QCD4_9SPIO|nr:hypothetical protein [Thiospirochaeta perfilievii]QEN04579.1 hypothetical protein EW093_07635 [Thiospirochaeta perfilievii]